MQRDGSSSPDRTVKSGRRGRRRSRTKSKPRKDSDSRSKRDYIDEISLKTGLGRPLLKVVLNLLLDGIMRDLAEGKRVEFREFGAFMIQQRAPRRAQNPKTLEPVIVPARRIIKFKPGIRLRELIDDGEPVIRLYPPKPQEGDGAQAAPEIAAQRVPVQEPNRPAVPAMPVEGSVGAGPEASGSAEARTEQAPMVASPERSSEIEARPHTGKRTDTAQASGAAASGAAASGAAPDTNGDAESRRDVEMPEVEATRPVRRQEYDRTDRSRAARAGQPINGALGQSRPAESLKPH